MILERSNNISELNKCVLSSNIFEYDIESANACALKLLKGEQLYLDLINLPKEERVIRVGNMMKSEPRLYNQVENILINWRNEFIHINKIKKENIIETTRDSVLVKNTIPTQTKLQGYVNFRTKGEEYSSYIFLTPQLRLLYDNLRRKIKIKGVKDEYVDNSKFVKKILVPIFQALEQSISVGYITSFAALKRCRENYLLATDMEIYRELLNKNRIVYNKFDNVIESDNVLPNEDESIDKSSNYLNFVFPLLTLKN